VNTRQAIEQFRIRHQPNYMPQDDEEVVCRAAFEARKDTAFMANSLTDDRRGFYVRRRSSI
jgi:hypothetical protein